ncbi:MAG: NUDIX domain-containing protein [Clostridiales bacterium]|nr:NUDIX domain-containing protein [Candidatus Cacconaster stercorequi]
MEYWDIYDVYRNKTGRTGIRGEQVAPGDYHLVIHVIIFNSAGQMLIQQRQSCKKSWPDKWDITVGGCAMAGENSQQAAMRELQEELGLHIDLTNTAPDLMVGFKEGFDDMYLLVRDIDLSTLTLQADEVQAVRWADQQEILDMIASGDFICYQPSLIPLLFDLRFHGGGLTE